MVKLSQVVASYAIQDSKNTVVPESARILIEAKFRFGDIL